MKTGNMLPIIRDAQGGGDYAAGDTMAFLVGKQVAGTQQGCCICDDTFYSAIIRPDDNQFSAGLDASSCINQVGTGEIAPFGDKEQGSIKLPFQLRIGGGHDVDMVCLQTTLQAQQVVMTDVMYADLRYDVAERLDQIDVFGAHDQYRIALTKICMLQHEVMDCLR